MAPADELPALGDAEIAGAPPVIPDTHPGIAAICKRKVARLTDTLHDPLPAEL